VPNNASFPVYDEIPTRTRDLLMIGDPGKRRRVPKTFSVTAGAAGAAAHTAAMTFSSLQPDRKDWLPGLVNCGQYAVMPAIDRMRT